VGHPWALLFCHCVVFVLLFMSKGEKIYF
jgi:hypothetical protein